MFRFLFVSFKLPASNAELFQIAANALIGTIKTKVKAVAINLMKSFRYIFMPLTLLFLTLHVAKLF